MEALIEVEAPVKFDQVKRNREEIILALRSGKYKQCQESYFYLDSMCFIGLGFRIFNIEIDQHKSNHIMRLREKLGLDRLFRIADYNDKGKTFPELADILVEDYNFPNVR